MNKVLGANPPTVCFLPWVGEFGWYIMNHVKRVHGYKSDHKIVCAKKGHECLFPTANEFYYEWADIPFSKKAGVSKNPRIDKLKSTILQKYGPIVLADPRDTSWAEKKSLARFHFKPQSKYHHNFNVDVAIAPRNRKIDPFRNYKHWQRLVNKLIAHGYNVGACGTAEESFDLKGVLKSWHYADIDTDVEIFNSAKVVIAQDSGLAYLAMLCERPLIMIGNCHKNIIDAHRKPGVFIQYLSKIDEIMRTINAHNCSFPGS